MIYNSHRIAYTRLKRSWTKYLKALDLEHELESHAHAYAYAYAQFELSNSLSAAGCRSRVFELYMLLAAP